MKPIMTLPCKNKHSDMEKREKGYHCKSCDHVLTDFRKLSEDEIQGTIRNNPGKTCGIFNAHQLDYKVSQVQLPKFRAVGLSLLGILGFLGPVVTSCDSDTSTSEIKQNAFNLLKFPMHVKGQVKDEKTGKALPFFEVQILQHGKVVKRSKTDQDGNFDILIKKDDLDQEVFKFVVGNHGHEKDIIPSNIKQFKGSKKVKLTIKAEGKTEIYRLGFIPPHVLKQRYETVPSEEIVEGIYEIDPVEPHEPLPELIEPEILEPEISIPQEMPVEKEATKKRERKIRKHN